VRSAIVRARESLDHEAWFTTRSLLDVITEEVAFKSGILLTDNDIRLLVDAVKWVTGDAFLTSLKMAARCAAEFIEDSCLSFVLL